MIVKIEKSGKSFKGLATYLTHDPKEKTANRVAWTHTLNLSHDDALSAVDEMLWTARAAELLKQEAGIRAGGRETESPVKHFSLNWAIGNEPAREHMIETAEDFLRHMGWHEHQVLLVAHQDKAFAHVHGMIDAVHPETGLKLQEGFEHRRAQAWALAYEQEHGRIYCEQRLLNAAEREDAPTRPAWMAFKNKQVEFERDENALQDQNAILVHEQKELAPGRSAEWKKLKDIQRRERECFFAEGKLEFSELRRGIYREVREEFRERWADFYAAQKDGAPAITIAEAKQQLIAEQKELLESRRDEACAQLRDKRNVRYRELLEDQRETRHQMRTRQDGGFDNQIFLRLFDEKDVRHDRPLPSFQSVAEEAATPVAGDQNVKPAASFGRNNHHHGLKSGADVGAGIATGLGFGFLSILTGIADGLTGSSPEVSPVREEPKPRADLFDAAVEHARKHQREQEDASDEYRRRQRSYGE